MADLAAIAGGFQTRLETVSGLHAYSEWPDGFQAPGAIVLPAEPFIVDATFDGGFDAEWDILVMVTRAGGDARSQVSLLSYFATSGSGSIRAAILGDATLGGTVASLIPLQVYGYGVYKHSGVSYAGMKYRWRTLT